MPLCGWKAILMMWDAIRKQLKSLTPCEGPVQVLDQRSWINGVADPLPLVSMVALLSGARQPLFSQIKIDASEHTGTSTYTVEQMLVVGYERRRFWRGATCPIKKVTNDARSGDRETIWEKSGRGGDGRGEGGSEDILGGSSFTAANNAVESCRPRWCTLTSSALTGISQRHRAYCRPTLPRFVIQSLGHRTRLYLGHGSVQLASSPSGIQSRPLTRNRIDAASLVQDRQSHSLQASTVLYLPIAGA
jgi:hypothetical protein